MTSGAEKQRRDLLECGRGTGAARQLLTEDMPAGRTVRSLRSLLGIDYMGIAWRPARFASVSAPGGTSRPGGRRRGIRARAIGTGGATKRKPRRHPRAIAKGMDDTPLHLLMGRNLQQTKSVYRSGGGWRRRSIARESPLAARAIANGRRWLRHNRDLPQGARRTGARRRVRRSVTITAASVAGLRRGEAASPGRAAAPRDPRLHVLAAGAAGDRAGSAADIWPPAPHRGFKRAARAKTALEVDLALAVPSKPFAAPERLRPSRPAISNPPNCWPPPGVLPAIPATGQLYGLRRDGEDLFASIPPPGLEQPVDVISAIWRGVRTPSRTTDPSGR